MSTLDLSLYLLTILGGAQPYQGDANNRDGCAIPLAVFVPTLKTDVENKVRVDSPIRKAALHILLHEIKRGVVVVSSRKEFAKGIEEAVRVEPSEGKALIDGIEWDWRLSAGLGPWVVYKKPRPMHAKFRPRLRLTVSTSNETPDVQLIQATSSADRWFYIIAGGGREQNGMHSPKAKEEGKKRCTVESQAPSAVMAAPGNRHRHRARKGVRTVSGPFARAERWRGTLGHESASEPADGIGQQIDVCWWPGRR